MDSTPERKLDIFRTMLLSRRLDERAWVLHRQKKISFHISAIGHEAAQVGAAFALLHGADWVAPYPRDLALMLSLGLRPVDYFKMLLGKPADEDSGGRQMPGHWNLPSANVISISGIAASHLPHAVGIAQAMRLRRDQTAVLASCGEGATSMGEWYEAVNWAAVSRLPIVFLVQNNSYAISTHQKAQMLRSPSHKASGIGLPVKKVDGNDPFKVYEAVDRMLEDARSGKGPGLVEALVMRIPPHSSDDDDRIYRTREEVEEARREDPLFSLRSRLLREGLLTRDLVLEMDADIKTSVEEALQAAEEAEDPQPDAETGAVYAT
ncbi:MAG: thiamine pyrophosphate-dependent dehydrogenase E1 component subunit alpha, partial [Anaerolineales bacterium]